MLCKVNLGVIRHFIYIDWSRDPKQIPRNHSLITKKKEELSDSNTTIKKFNDKLAYILQPH